MVEGNTGSWHYIVSDDAERSNLTGPPAPEAGSAEGEGSARACFRQKGKLCRTEVFREELSPESRHEMLKWPARTVGGECVPVVREQDAIEQPLRPHKAERRSESPSSGSLTIAENKPRLFHKIREAPFHPEVPRKLQTCFCGFEIDRSCF